MASNQIQLFVLQTGWGVPFETSAPFPLKLATWMRMMELDFEWVVENNTAKGPKGKSPWIEDGSVRMGDSTLIMEYLTKKHGLPNLDADLGPEQRAVSTLVQRTLEEHYHQCFEHQLFFGEGGEARFAELVASMPPVIGPLIGAMVRRAFDKQLHARGMARHSDDVIIAQGRQDLDAISVLLGDKPFIHGDDPTLIDACVFGFLGVTLYVEGDNGLFSYVSMLPNLVSYCERMRARYFPETLQKLPLLEGTVAVGKAERSAA